MGEQNLWTLISKTVSESGSIEQAVFFLLVGLSLASWCIVLLKLTDLHTAKKNNANFVRLFESADSFGAVMTTGANAGSSPLQSIFKAAMASLESRKTVIGSRAIHDPRAIQLKPTDAPEDMLVLDMQVASQMEYEKLRKGLAFLATIGATSPFIGLFGTVWGIMDTFRALGTAQNASLAVVAPGISSALIATAAGLVVAIPAVMAYNWFLTRLNQMQDSTDNFIQRLRVLVMASGILHSPPASASSPAAVHVAPAAVPTPPAQAIAVPQPAAVSASSKGN
jgi:biopolymer transport protein TolQ